MRADYNDQSLTTTDTEMQTLPSDRTRELTGLQPQWQMKFHSMEKYWPLSIILALITRDSLSNNIAEIIALFKLVIKIIFYCSD